MVSTKRVRVLFNLCERDCEVEMLVSAFCVHMQAANDEFGENASKSFGYSYVNFSRH